MSTLPQYTLCISPDSYLLKVRINTLLAAHTLPSGPWEKFVYWGDEPFPSSFWEHLTLQGLFATNKAVIVRNAQNISADSLRVVSQTIINASQNIWPILCFETPFERGKPKLAAHITKLPCYLLAEKKGFLDVIAGLDIKSQPVFIRQECKRLGISLSKHQEGLLIQLLPYDALYISSELAKLALLTEAEGKLSDNSLSILENTGEISIFSLLQTLQTGQNPLTVWNHLQQDALEGEKSVFAFVAILLREARQLWQILLGEPVSLPPHILTSKKVAASSIGLSGVAKIWELSLQVEKGIKTGEMIPEQAFEMLAAQLFQLFTPHA